VISHKLLGTQEWFVIHHTNCGMELFTDQIMGEVLADSLATATSEKGGWRNKKATGGSPEGRYVSWLTIRDQAQRIEGDVRRIRLHPLLPKDVPIYGYLYDVKTGKLAEIASASNAGRARR
jgi:carbonic anhydrase